MESPEAAVCAEPAAGQGRRASKACETCRAKKIKCDESRPTCRYCRKRKLPCQYRQENRPVRDPTLSLIFDRLNQLQDSVQAVEGRLMKLDASSPRPTRPPTKFVHGVPSPDSTRDDYIRPSTVPESNAEQSDLHRRSPQPASDVLRWDCCRRCFPRLSSKYQDPDRFSNYSGIPNSNLSISLLLQPEPAAETGQVFSHVRNFLDHVYPLYPIVCEQAISDMTTEFIREGPRTNIQSALVLLMVCLAKLLVSGNPSDELTAENDLDGAVQILNWVPLENSLEHAQAQFLAALCFSKFSMLSTSVAFLQRSSAVLYEFLLRKVLSSAQIKLTTRTTSVRLYWVVLNLERDLCWETPLYTLGPLSQLEDRLPLPMECMVQNAASANTAGQSETYHSAIDACYPLFLAETSLRQICWRVSSAPELQEDFASAKESHVYSPGSSSSPNATLVLPVVTELSSQVSRWLECVPAAANWSPKAEPGPVTPLSTRVKLLYWMCRFNVHKSALRHVSLYNDSLEVADGLTQVRAKAALEAAARSLYVFCEENFAADEVLAHRLLMLLVVLSTSLMVLGAEGVRASCPDLTISPHMLVERCARRLDILVRRTAGGYSERRWKSRWLSEDLDVFFIDAGLSRQ